MSGVQLLRKEAQREAKFDSRFGKDQHLRLEVPMPECQKYSFLPVVAWYNLKGVFSPLVPSQVNVNDRMIEGGFEK